MPTVFLTDNGSLRASSTLSLRKIAAALETRTGQDIAPVSLLHSSRVDPSELGGEPAEVLERAVLRRLEEGEKDFVVLPLFFGPSRALTDYLPKRLAFIRTKFPDACVRVAPPLFDSRQGTDSRLARILKERVVEVLTPEEKLPVVLVDHGSPAPEVTYVRNFIAGQLSIMLADCASRVIAASMERRPGDEYRFSGPLLEEVLQQDGFNKGKVVVAMLFLSPGRHAGEGGDVVDICKRCQLENPSLSPSMTQLVGNHPQVIEILADRLHQTLSDA